MSCRFPGTQDNNLIRTTDLLNVNANYTAMQWVYISVDTNAYANFMYMGIADAASPADAIQVAADGTTFNCWVGGDGFTELSGSALSVTTWYHVAMVRTSTTNLYAYLNGVIDITNTRSVIPRQPTNVNSLAAWRLGGNTDFDPLNGRIAGFKAWTTDLTQAEIQQEMQQFLPVRTANLHSFCPFIDASTGTDFLDYSGNGRNWTEEGTVTFEDNPPIPWRRGRSRMMVPSAASGFGSLLASRRNRLVAA